MAVSLQKGQRVNLKKDGGTLDKIMIGLGWDAAKKGFFGLVGKDIDCDASAIMLGSDEKLIRKEHVVYFGNLKSPDTSIVHCGDNLTGSGDGDDEQIIVELNKVPPEVSKIVFVVNIYDCINRKHDFGLIQNAFIRVVNEANEELLRYDLTESYAGKTAVIVGEIYRHSTEWKFAAIGEGTHDVSLSELIKRYLK